MDLTAVATSSGTASRGIPLTFHNIFNYLLIRPEEYNMTLRYKKFSGRAEIEAFLGDVGSPDNLSSFRQALQRAGHAFESWEQATQVLADQIEAGFYLVREVRHPSLDYGPGYDPYGLVHPGRWDYHPDPEEKEPAPTKEEPKHADLTFARFRFVDDETGLPIAGLNIKITFSDDYEMNMRSNASGLLEIQKVASGPCTLRCDLKGVRLDTCVQVVGTGENPTGAEVGPHEAPTPQRAQHIAIVRARKVTKKDTLDSLAKEVDVSGPELAEFNFGTRDASEIERFLSACVGCTQKNAAGELIFDDQDDPGIIFLPTPWSQKAATSQENVIRLRAVNHKISIDYEIGLDNPETKDDTITLASKDGN
jgi:hypothetical protein